MAKRKLFLTKKHFRVFITMDQLVKKTKACRSAVYKAVKRFVENDETKTVQIKYVRTGLRGPASKAMRVR